MEKDTMQFTVKDGALHISTASKVVVEKKQPESLALTSDEWRVLKEHMWIFLRRVMRDEGTVSEEVQVLPQILEKYVGWFSN